MDGGAGSTFIFVLTLTFCADLNVIKVPPWSQQWVKVGHPCSQSPVSGQSNMGWSLALLLDPSQSSEMYHVDSSWPAYGVAHLVLAGPRGRHEVYFFL